MAADRTLGRPRQTPPLPPDAPVTADGVEPVITIAQLDGLAKKLGCRSRTEFAEALGLSQGHVSNLYAGRKQILHGPLHLLLIERLKQHRIR